LVLSTGPQLTWRKSKLARSFLTKYHFHHPTFAVERVTLPRKYVGRGLKDISALHNKPVFNLHNFMRKKKAQTSGIHRTVYEANDKFTFLNPSLDDLPAIALPVID
jgi:hypothetical protein